MGNEDPENEDPKTEDLRKGRPPTKFMIFLVGNESISIISIKLFSAGIDESVNTFQLHSMSVIRNDNISSRNKRRQRFVIYQLQYSLYQSNTNANVRDVTKCGNGERKSGNESAAVTRRKIQNGGGIGGNNVCKH